MRNVRFKCPHCGQLFDGSSDDIGITADCPLCHKPFKLEETGEIVFKLPTPILWYFGAFQKYFKFSGRARRREYWWFYFFHVLASTIIGAIDAICECDFVLLGLYTLAALFPLLTVQVRRLHDTNKSGWWVLLLSIPVLNLALFVWLCTDSDNGNNRFGCNPKGF